MYYVFITNNEINGKGQCECTGEDTFSIEITEEVYNNLDHYIYSNGEIVLNPNYEQEKAEKEAERVGNLTMTALDFIGVLEHYGLDYATQIKPFLEANPELDKQLKYCQNVWCGVAKQVFSEPITIGNITITAEMVETAFKVKNGEL